MLASAQAAAFTSRRSIAAAAPLQRRPFRLLPPPQALAAAGCYTARCPRRAAVAAGCAPLAAGSSASRSQWRARRHCGVGVRGRGSGWGGAVQRQRGAGVAVDGLPRHGGGRVRLLRVRHLCRVFCADSSWNCERHWVVQLRVWCLWICFDNWSNDWCCD